MKGEGRRECMEEMSPSRRVKAPLSWVLSAAGSACSTSGASSSPGSSEMKDPWGLCPNISPQQQQG